MGSAGGRKASENLSLMKKAVLVALCAMGLTCFAPGASADNVAIGGRVIAGGGTPVSNGVFTPGTAIPNEDGGVDPVLPPMQIEQGTDVELINLDESAVANAHKMVSLKRRAGKPLFSSDLVRSPGDSTLVVTSHLKPGLYPYYCTVHTAMWGQLEVVR